MITMVSCTNKGAEKTKINNRLMCFNYEALYDYQKKIMSLLNLK